MSIYFYCFKTAEVPDNITALELITTYSRSEFIQNLAVTSQGHYALPIFGTTRFLLCNPDLSLVADFNIPGAISLRDVVWRCGMLFFPDMSAKCIHVTGETGIYSHAIDLAHLNINLAAIAAYGNALYVSVLSRSTIYRVILDRNNNATEIEPFSNSVTSINAGQKIAVTGGRVMVSGINKAILVALNIYGEEEWAYAGPLPGPENEKLDKPYGIHIDRLGRSYVADGKNKRVVMISEDGEFIMNIITGLQGQPKALSMINDTLLIMETTDSYGTTFSVYNII